MLLPVAPSSCFNLLLAGTTVLKQKRKTLRLVQALQLCPGAGVLTARSLPTARGKGIREDESLLR